MKLINMGQLDTLLAKLTSCTAPFASYFASFYIVNQLLQSGVLIGGILVSLVTMRYWWNKEKRERDAVRIKTED